MHPASSLGMVHRFEHELGHNVHWLRGTGGAEDSQSALREVPAGLHEEELICLLCFGAQNAML